MENNLDNLLHLLLGDGGLLISLRMGDGLQKDKVTQVIDVLGKLESEWFGKDCIPKKAVDLFIDIFPVMESSLGFYKESEVIAIMDAADKIIDKIRDIIIH